MNAPVSIVIPCYNSAHFLPDALNSALAQEYTRVQVLVVNDGSTDDFEGAIVPYRADARIKIITQENRGLSAARNRGIQESSGDYIKFLDADDWLTPDAIRKQVAVFETQPELGLVYCDVQHVDAQGKLLDNYSVTNTRRVLSGDILPSLLVGGYFTPNTVLVPRRVLDRVGWFDETLSAREDYDLWMRIACEGYAAQYVPEKLAYYRRHGDNMTNDAAWMKETHLRALDTIVTRYPHRVAAALHELMYENERVDRDSAWARETIAAQQKEIDALKRALDTRGVRAARTIERWSASWRR